MDTLCSSSPASSTTRTREDPQTPALHRCPMDGDLSSKCRPKVSLGKTPTQVYQEFHEEI